jgi:hypothetical protein
MEERATIQSDQSVGPAIVRNNDIHPRDVWLRCLPERLQCHKCCSPCLVGPSLAHSQAVECTLLLIGLGAACGLNDEKIQALGLCP